MIVIIKQIEQNVSKYYITNDDEKQMYYEIKDYYFNKIHSKFRIKKTIDVIFLKDYETDLIPHYVISRELLFRKNSESVNLILSMDKDLLQCCSFRKYLSKYLSICLKKKRILK